MVPKANEDLPDPEIPVNATSASRGATTSAPRRLWTRVPYTRTQGSMSSVLLWDISVIVLDEYPCCGRASMHGRCLALGVRKHGAGIRLTVRRGEPYRRRTLEPQATQLGRFDYDSACTTYRRHSDNVAPIPRVRRYLFGIRPARPIAGRWCRQ